MEVVTATIQTTKPSTTVTTATTTSSSSATNLLTATKSTVAKNNNHNNNNNAAISRRSSTGATATGNKLRDVGALTREDFDGGPVSLDEIEPGLYLGNLTAATHMETLKAFKITHILTLDSVPLPQHIVEASFLTTKYIHIADLPKEDILHHLDACVDFISEALEKGGNILVHCYFGVSRSSSVIIAYIMKKLDCDFQQAFDLVRFKRRFVQPNSGFVAQLKLYRRMGCRIDSKNQKYKLYRLRLAGEQVRRAKILPQAFHNLIKPDPAITQANPEPNVYRCRKCRRVLATKSHLIVHQIKSQQQQQQQIQAANGGGGKQQELTQGVMMGTTRLLEQIAAQIRKASLGGTVHNQQTTVNNITATATTTTTAVNAEGSSVFPTHNNLGFDETEICRSIIFVEPIAWMRNISHDTQGRLNCPKCDQKLGNFSWINGCQCPCGEEMSPAFYLIPSRVELSKTVQNVQTTI